ncbi:MAG: TonB-dependent receptor plug domain-containing protein [Bacteroidota bacterium]
MAPLIVNCQSNSQADSGKVYPLPIITVRANQPVPMMFRSPFSVSTISLDDSIAPKTPTLDNALSSTDGIFIKDYSGLSGIKTISQRGLGSEHTLILLNGMRISSFENGLVDLGIIPLDAGNRVIVTHGGQSAEYGPDAVGGTVNILSQPNFNDNTKIGLTSTIGSFGRTRSHLNAETPVSENFRIGGGFGVEKSEENYPFLFHNGNITSTVIRQNSDLVAQFGNFNSSLLINSLSSLSIFSTYYNTERGSPNSISSPDAISHQRLADRDGVVQAAYSLALSAGDALSVTVQDHYAYERYRDPDFFIGGNLLDDYFKNNDARVTGKFSSSYDEGKFQIVAGADASETSAEGNSINTGVSRSELGAFMTGVSTFSFDNSVLSGISFFPALRMDMIEKSSPVFSPQLGGLMKFKTTDIGFINNFQSAIRASMSRNFRMPTFNELYYTTGGGIGNPDLQPEHSTSFDAGTDVSFNLDGRHELKATYFMTDMDNRITWVSAGGANVTPKNLRHVQSFGWEINYAWHSPGDIFSLDLNYTSTIARKISEDYPGDPTVFKQLLYVPEEMANISFGVTKHFDAILIRTLGAKFRTGYTGFRYTSEDNASFLPSFYESSLEFNSRLDISTVGTRMKFEIRNIFNKDYQVILGYPMPMRYYSFTVELDY